MAGDTEDLVLSISADVRQMQRALQRITGETSRTAAALAKSFDGVGDVGGAAFNKVAANSNKAAAAVLGSANRINGAMKASSFQTANLASQLNDIGVQLAGGTSPFQIALQQGSQINQVLGGGGARGAVAALGGAFASLVNPVSLATIGIIALGGAAVQYFSSVLSDGAKSEEQLKREAELIQRVAKEWGDALPAVKAYAEERSRALEETARKEATDIALSGAYEEARNTITAVRGELAALQQELFNLDPEGALALQRAFADLDKAVQEQNGGVEEANRVTTALSALFTNTSIPATEALAERFGGLASALGLASERAAQLRADLAKAKQEAAFQEGLKNQVFTPLDPLGAFNADRDQTNRANATKSQFQLDQERLAKSRSSAASEAEREAQAVADLIDQLEFEQSLIGATSLEREQATALRRAGSAATAEQQEKIKGLIAATYAEKEAIKQQEDAYKALQQIGTQAINSLATALSDGKLEGQELLSILGQIVQQMLSMPSLGGGSGFGGLISGLFGSIFHKGGIVGEGGPKRNVHPSVFAGAPRYHSGGVAGLRPGEVPAILQRGEVVLPKGVGARQAGPQQITITLVGEEGEMFTPRVQQISGQTAGVVVRESRPQLSRDAVNAVQQASRNRPGIFR